MPLRPFEEQPLVVVPPLKCTECGGHLVPLPGARDCKCSSEIQGAVRLSLAKKQEEALLKAYEAAKAYTQKISPPPQGAVD